MLLIKLVWVYALKKPPTISRLQDRLKINFVNQVIKELLLPKKVVSSRRKSFLLLWNRRQEMKKLARTKNQRDIMKAKSLNFNLLSVKQEPSLLQILPKSMTVLALSFWCHNKNLRPWKLSHWLKLSAMLMLKPNQLISQLLLTMLRRMFLRKLGSVLKILTSSNIMKHFQLFA